MAEHTTIPAETVVLTTTSALVAVYDGKQQCIGFVNRGESGTEAYDINERSIGLFKDDVAAATAIWRCAHNQKSEWAS